MAQAAHAASVRCREAMDVDAVSTFFALLAVVGLVFVAVVVVCAIFARLRGGLPDALVPLRDGLGDVALWLGAAVALTCMLGSLYMSEVAHFPPCPMCWYQRICMYPLVVVVGVAAWRRDASVRWYALPLAVIGICFSTYHYLIERFPDQVKSFCTTDVPCSTVWVWKLHFLSIPGMAWVGFLLVITLLLLARPATDGESGAPTLTDRHPEEVPA
jgi:disulfide bond formation protein DsbB